MLHGHSSLSPLVACLSSLASRPSPLATRTFYLAFLCLNSLMYFSGFSLNSSRQPLQQT